MAEPKRTCFECTHYILCSIRHGVTEALQQTRYINIDGPSTPGKWVDIFEAVARACEAFEETKRGGIAA